MRDDIPNMGAQFPSINEIGMFPILSIVFYWRVCLLRVFETTNLNQGWRYQLMR